MDLRLESRSLRGDSRWSPAPEMALEEEEEESVEEQPPSRARLGVRPGIPGFPAAGRPLVGDGL